MGLAATAQAMPGSASTWRRAAISSQWCTIIVLIRYDALRPQRLAAPVKVYVEQFSAHPLESDMAELYGPPDGYIGANGEFRKEKLNGVDKPVYEIELRPEDGVYPLPYMARQSDGRAWE